MENMNKVNKRSNSISDSEDTFFNWFLYYCAKVNNGMNNSPVVLIW